MMFTILILMAVAVYAQDLSLQIQPDASMPIRHPDCPLVDDILHPVMLPYPNDCTKYYSCLNGYAYTKICPNNLFWCQLTYRCDYPEVAKCSEALPLPIPTPSPSPSPSPLPQPLVPSWPVYHSDSNDCSQYFQCQKLRCPMNMLWSDRMQQCVLSYMSECPSSSSNYGIPTVSPTLGNLPVAIAPTASTPPALTGGNSIETATPTPTATSAHEFDNLCGKYKGEVYINYPGDCHRYIQCNGFAFVHICPANLYWNSMLKTCDTYCV